MIQVQKLEDEEREDCGDLLILFIHRSRLMNGIELYSRLTHYAKL